MTSTVIPSPAADRTKTRVLTLLKSRRCTTAQSVAEALDISVPAARRHLCDLTEAGLIVAETQRPGGRGRPQFVYRLSERGEAQFPKSYASLCVDVLRHIDSLFGEGAVMRVMDARRAALAQEWAPRLTGSPAERLTKLAALLSEAGYEARAYEEDGALYLEQGNCPNLDVARRYDELCGAELELYRSLLGVPVRRETRIACGAPTCRYRVG
ncbi:helix-turn-helix transcriptional regulator [Deinococcus pimensis]|uniref:helix-turn-helix transcriptional regulator n=1 Tax=Deinococcus pimensis TaxID=309888 RepID=UPI0004844973|nr:metalloregulator ArsR/SmtB family transcription factor [Deinococcus pimensis]